MPSQILERTSNAGSQMWNSLRGIFGNHAARDAAQDAITTTRLSGATRIISLPFQGGLWVLKQPLKLADHLGGRVIGGVGNFFARHPKTAWIGTGVVAVGGIGSYLNRRAERQTQADLQQQFAQAQMQAAAMAQTQAQAQTTITAEDMAVLNARMAQGGRNAQGFGAAVQADKAGTGITTPAV